MAGLADLFDMLPRLSAVNISRRGMAQVEHFRNFTARYSVIHQYSYEPHLILIKLMKWMGFSWHTVRSAFSGFVSVIFSLSATKQMLRITAGAVIAMVTHTQAFWNRTNRKHERKSMGRLESPFPLCFPVAVCGYGGHPVPTIVGTFNINTVPKPFLCGRFISIFAPPRICSFMASVNVRLVGSHRRQITTSSLLLQ